MENIDRNKRGFRIFPSKNTKQKTESGLFKIRALNQKKKPPKLEHCSPKFHNMQSKLVNKPHILFDGNENKLTL